MDSIVLYPPGGGASPLQVGSWLRADPGPDFGARGLVQAIEAESFADGGRFVYDRAGVRRMAFPLLMGAQLGPNYLENPGLETGTYYPYLISGAGNASVVGASAYEGTSMLRVVVPASAANAYTNITCNPIAVTAGERVHVAAAMNAFQSPGSSNSYLRFQFLLAGDLVARASGLTVLPDARSPGYRFGSDDAGAFNQFALPIGTWLLIGGNVAAPSGYPYMTLDLYPGFLPIGTTIIGMDRIEIRTSSGERAVREWESQVREYAQPGGYIDVQPEGVPSSEAVRFDLIHGRYEPQYQVQYQRAGRRAADLMLDTDPFGYWPTVILLASVASHPFPSGIAFTAGSVIGDAPALAEVFVSPHAALPSQQAAGAWRTDAIGWSLNGHGPSFNPFIAGGSFSVANFTAGGSVLDPAAPATSMLQAIYGQTAMASWIPAFYWHTPTALEPAYRGRFRAFTFLKTTPSGVPPYQISIDVVAGEKYAGGILPALASAAPVATVPPGLASQNPGLGSAPGTDLYGAVPSHGYVIVDCGEIALPPAASGFSTRTALRVWAKQGVLNTTLASQTMWLGGVYLLPVDSAQAIVTRGILSPSVNDQNSVYGGVTPSVGYVHKIGYGPMFTVKGGVHYDSLLQFTRGAVQPVLGATVNRLDLIAFDRAIGPNAATYDPMVHVQQHRYSTVSVSYTPRFLFLKGL